MTPIATPISNNSRGFTTVKLLRARTTVPPTTVVERRGLRREVPGEDEARVLDERERHTSGVRRTARAGEAYPALSIPDIRGRPHSVKLRATPGKRPAHRHASGCSVHNILFS